MSDGTVHLRQDGPVGRITFDRPAARNAMTWEMYAELGEICARLSAERSVAGGGLPRRRRQGLRRRHRHRRLRGLRLGRRRHRLREPDGRIHRRRSRRCRCRPVAAVEGFAVGGGLAIAAACDFRIATPDARFGAPIARTLGNCLSAKSYARLAAALGIARAKRVLLLGEMIGADEAKAAGFLYRGRRARRPRHGGRRISARNSPSNAPLTQEASKEALRRLVYANVPPMDDLIGRTYGSEDFRRGVRAFLAKAPPEWTGK